MPFTISVKKIMKSLRKKKTDKFQLKTEYVLDIPFYVYDHNYTLIFNNKKYTRSRAISDTLISILIF